MPAPLPAPLSAILVAQVTGQAAMLSGMWMMPHPINAFRESQALAQAWHDMGKRVIVGLCLTAFLPPILAAPVFFEIMKSGVKD